MPADNIKAARALRRIAKFLGQASATLHNQVLAEEVRISMVLLEKFPDPANRPRLRYHTLRSELWTDTPPEVEQPKGYDTQVARYFRGGAGANDHQEQRVQKRRRS